jgi:hypothetical protein
MTASFDDTPGNTDWMRSGVWDVRNPNGALVESLAGLATVLGVEEAEAAEVLLSTPFGKAAPAGLRAEAEALRSGEGPESFDDLLDGAEEPIEEPTLETVGGGLFEDTDDLALLAEGKAFGGKQAPPFGSGKGKGDKTPDKAGEGSATVKRGQFVKWSGGRGKVDLIVTGGVVPGVDGKPVFGSKTGPAARVRKYAKDGNGWKATDERVAVKASDLTAIDDLPKRESKGLADDAPAALVSLAQMAEGMVEAKALSTAYERGLAGWPGSDKTDVPHETWALGRAGALVRASQGRPIAGFADGDLLPG